MINFFSDYLRNNKDKEIISIPWYHKKLWKRCAKTSSISYAKYHDVSMLCEYILNIISDIPDSRIRFVRFVYMDDNGFIRWARANNKNPRSFFTQTEYAASLSDITVNALWQKFVHLDVYNLGGLLVRDTVAKAPSVTCYSLSEINDLLSILLAGLAEKMSIQAYPYIVPLAEVPALLPTFHNDAKAFGAGSGWFAPKFTNLSLQEVSEGEEWSSEGILYLIPIKISPILSTATIDLRIFNSRAEEVINLGEKSTSINTLLKGLNPNFKLVHSGIFPLNFISQKMLEVCCK